MLERGRVCEETPLLQGQSCSACTPDWAAELETSFVSPVACLANTKNPSIPLSIHLSILILTNKWTGLRR